MTLLDNVTQHSLTFNSEQMEGEKQCVIQVYK